MEGEELKPVFPLSLYPSYEEELELDGKVSDKVEGIAAPLKEMRRLIWLAGPLITVGFLQYSLQLISVVFVGHLRELSLSSASTATSFAGVTGFILLVRRLGMGSALDTFLWPGLRSKAVPDAGRAQAKGHVCSLTNVHSDLFHMVLHQPDTDDPWARSRNLDACWDICSLVDSIYNLGNKGAALANAVSYWTNVVMLALYIKFSPTCKKTWAGLSKAGLHDSINFLRLAIPSTLMVSLEYWPYEILVIMSGFLPNPKLETSMMSISFDTCCLVFRIPYGLGSAVSTRVSNELGAGNPQAARLAARIVLFMAVTAGTIVATSLILARSVWGYLYTNEVELVRYLKAIMPVLVISNFMDGIQAVLSGVARGCGWQKTGAYVNLGAYYLVGLPSAIILTFMFHVGGKGFWMGITYGSSLQSFLLLMVMLRTNWDQEANKARDRMFSPNILADGTINMLVLSANPELPKETSTPKYHIIAQQRSEFV
ncbi:hypothetical protein IFM89_032012 [Coptis chinensis]|uniref:Protein DETOXIFICATION n=1 Tax=Coptis chinensis TaxID=261450 RepID=A0A835GZD5_9MAGN|nr:hypothetical protein IFM89_032012 [Coptis chinensis]